MPSVVELSEPNELKRSATPANLRLGQEIIEQEGVTLIEVAPQQVTAKVGGVPAADGRRTVTLKVGQSGLQWSCTCTKRGDLFCKHGVATALAMARSELP
jgi:uncharacterized Zn finger protein